MLYLLTQHSTFTRKHHPFLLCKCRRGECFRNKNHKCNMLSTKEYKKLYDKSKKIYGITCVGVKEHKDWCDEYNFGLSPDIFPLEYISIDVFHCRCAVTRRIQHHLRMFMIKQEPMIKVEFTKLLMSFWSEYKIIIWNCNKPFTCFIGSDLLKFIMASDKIVGFMKKFLMKHRSLKVCVREFYCGKIFQHLWILQQ